MKKMMIIAVLISGMLMPAQIMAKENRGNKKPKVEYRNNKIEKGDKKDKKAIAPPGKDKKKGYGRNCKDDKKGKPMGYKDNKKGYKNDYCKKPGKPDVIVVNKPAPVPPPPPAKVVYKSDPASAAASLVGLAALIAIIAD